MPKKDTYRPTTTQRTSQELVFDPVSKTWVKKSASINTGATKPPTSKASDIVVVDPTSKVDSRTEAEKQYIDIEFNTLTGELNLTSTEKSIRIRVNDTVKLEGLGKYLSGTYFVSAVKRMLNKDSGYTHVLTVIKTGFGNSLKSISVSRQIASPLAVPAPPTQPRKPEAPPSTPPAPKVGDKVKIVGANATYSNAHDGVKVPAWVKQKVLTVDAISSDKMRVRLMPIWSWTYIKYVQKV